MKKTLVYLKTAVLATLFLTFSACDKKEEITPQPADDSNARLSLKDPLSGFLGPFPKADFFAVAMEVSTTYLIGGESLRVAVKINAPAPAGGTLITITSTGKEVVYEPGLLRGQVTTILIPEGQLLGTATVQTLPVPDDRGLSLGASPSLLGVGRLVVLDVRPPSDPRPTQLLEAQRALTQNGSISWNWNNVATPLAGEYLLIFEYGYLNYPDEKARLTFNLNVEVNGVAYPITFRPFASAFVRVPLNAGFNNTIRLVTTEQKRPGVGNLFIAAL